jgi:hypothetical protein
LLHHPPKARCLDSTLPLRDVLNVRIIVTIDPDTEALLKEETQRTGLSFKEVLNQSIRKSLSRKNPGQTRIQPLFRAPFPAAVEGKSMNHLADEWDDDETLRELGR